jgi:hypothetical protein
MQLATAIHEGDDLDASMIGGVRCLENDEQRRLASQQNLRVLVIKLPARQLCHRGGRASAGWNPRQALTDALADNDVAVLPGTRPRNLGIRNPIRKNLNTNQRRSGQNTSPISRLMSFRARSRGT